MLMQNYQWLQYIIRTILPQAVLSLSSPTSSADSTVWSANVTLSNEGLSVAHNHSVLFVMNTTLFSAVSLTLNGVN